MKKKEANPHQVDAVVMCKCGHSLDFHLLNGDNFYCKRCPCHYFEPKKWVKHIHKEGSRSHVKSYSAFGEHCNVVDCEINQDT